LIEEGERQLAGAVTDDHVGQRTTTLALELLSSGTAHFAKNRDLLARLEFADMGLMGAVEIAAGIVLKEIEQRLNFMDREPFGLFFADSAKTIDGEFREIPERERGIARRHRRLLQPEVVGIQRLTAGVNLELDVGVILLEPCHDLGGGLVVSTLTRNDRE